LHYQEEIERQQEALAKYRRELEALERDIETESAPAADNQALLAAIADLKQTVTRQHGESQGERRRMEARLAAGQQEILAHIERRHRQTIKTVLARLDDNQLELVNMMLREAEKDRLAREEATDLFNQTVRILQILQTQPDGDYWRRLLDAVEEPASLEQKLKLTLPIIPAILEYETELAVDGMGWLRDSWRTLTARARRRL
jgi:BMFP domain-containing protein YqiC